MAVLLAGAAVFFTAFPAGRALGKIKEGQEGIRFTGTNFITNQPLDLNNDLKKKVILLDFGSIYCSSCMVTVPNLIKLSKEYQEDKLAIYNIYLDIYNPQRVIRFFMGFGKDLQFSLLIDDKLSTSREYGVDTLPTTVVIDRSGVVRRVITGYTENDEKEINKLIGDLVNELPSTAVSQAQAEQNLQVFSPESFTKTTNDAVFLVGFVGGPGVKDVSIKLNNLPEKITKTKDNIFHFRSNLSLAMNLIEVKSQVEEEKVKSESVVIFREPRLGMEIKSELPDYRFHVDDEKSPCVKCHKLTLSAQEKESMQSSQVCLACHRGLTNQIYVHGPISVGGCLPCHDYKSFPMKYELRSTGTSLCFTCHENMKEVLHRPNVHGPLAAGICVVCHDPHGSQEKFLLRKKLDQQCISCHQDILKDYAKNFVHTIVREGQCTGCHDPHSSDYQWFLKKSQQEICTICHLEGSYAHTHKVGEKPTKDINIEDPGAPLLTPAGLTTCETCHFVHSGDFNKLVKGGKDDYCARICH